MTKLTARIPGIVKFHLAGFSDIHRNQAINKPPAMYSREFMDAGGDLPRELLRVERLR